LKRECRTIIALSYTIFKIAQFCNRTSALISIAL